MEIEGPYCAVRRRLGVLARRRLAVPVPAHPRELDRGRHDRHPAEHRRRARARPAQVAVTEGTSVNFDLTDEQQMLQAAAREFLAARLKSERIRELAESDDAFSEDLWREMSELNWPGLMVSEKYGGQELGTVELAVLMEQLGYALAPGPDPLQHAGRRSRSRRRPPTSRRSATWRRSRPASSAGRSRCGTPAPGGRRTTSRSSPRRANGGYVLRGEKLFVLDAAHRGLLHRGRDAATGGSSSSATRTASRSLPTADDRRDPQAVRGEARRREGGRGRRVRR